MKKKLIIAAAVAGVAAAAVPAMALENEFHGMYKFSAYQSNFFNGATMSATQANNVLNKDVHSGFFAEQRARLQYIAKANDNLKLVTHFELDTRFGGKAEGYLGTTSNDAGSLDADQLTLETKNIYLDVNCPITGANFKVGIQPWADAYQSLFLLADMTGVYATKGFGPATASLGWFRFDDNTVAPSSTAGTTFTSAPGKLTSDLFVLDGKYAINKEMKVGASYYNVQADTGAQTGGDNFQLLHMIGLNADLTFGPANIKPMFAYQFGDFNTNDKITAFMLGAVTKTKVGPGAVNFSAIYLSGDDSTAAGSKRKDFQTVGANQTYFNTANMWLLVRNGGAVNSSTSILGNDMTVGGRGLMGVFAGYEGTMDKVFYNANLGYAQIAKAQAQEKKTIGTEINAQVGYKLYDNLSASAAVAYAILGKGMDSATAGERFAGANDAKDPYAINLQLSYVF